VIDRLRKLMAGPTSTPAIEKSPDRLEQLRTPEGEAIPPDTLAELKRDLARTS